MSSELTYVDKNASKCVRNAVNISCYLVKTYPRDIHIGGKIIYKWSTMMYAMEYFAFLKPRYALAAFNM